MRIRVEGDAGKVESWLIAKEYPHQDRWPADWLQQQAIMVRVEDGDYVAGYIWATWHPYFPHTLSFHACFAKEYRGKWFKALDDLYRLASYLGAEFLYGHTDNLSGRDKIMHQFLIRRLGFEDAGVGGVIKRLS